MKFLIFSLLLNFFVMPIFAKQTEDAKQAVMNKLTKDVMQYGIAPIDYKRYNKIDSVNIDVSVLKNRVWGKPNAKHTLVVFTDFACGKSKKAHELLKQRLTENAQNLNIYYILFPLDGECNPALKGKGKLSDKSCYYAKLALCAEKQNMFNKSIDMIFAGNVNDVLKIKDVQNCVNTDIVNDMIKKEAMLYKNIQIAGTPIVLLNKKRIGSIYKNRNQFNGLLNFIDLEATRNTKK